MSVERIVGTACVAAALLLVSCATPTSDVAKPTATNRYTYSPSTNSPTPKPTSTTSVTPSPDITYKPESVTVTLYGTDASFTWQDQDGIHQQEGQDGPFRFELSRYETVYVNVAVFTTNADAGCRVTFGDQVLLDNTLPNQTAATCSESFDL